MMADLGILEELLVWPGHVCGNVLGSKAALAATAMNVGAPGRQAHRVSGFPSHVGEIERSGEYSLYSRS